MDRVCCHPRVTDSVRDVGNAMVMMIKIETKDYRETGDGEYDRDKE